MPDNSNASRMNLKAAGPMMAAAFGLLIFLSGCVQETTRNGLPVANPTKPTAPKKPSGPPPPIDPSISDPCAVRLHDMCGEFILYVHVNKRLPAKLEEMALFAQGIDSPNPWDCEITKKPYVYNPTGLIPPPKTPENSKPVYEVQDKTNLTQVEFPDQPRRLIVYDPEPSHGGKRWGILFGEPAGNAPLRFDVVSLTEAQFKAFKGPVVAPEPAAEKP